MTLANVNHSTAVAALVCLTAGIQSCALTPDQAKALPSSDTANGASSMMELEFVREGESGHLFSEDGLVSPLGKVIIGRQYMAASGRTCKKVLDSEGVELLSVICKDSTGRWYLRRLY